MRSAARVVALMLAGLLASSAHAFSLDYSTRLYYTDTSDPDSLFGYSLAAYADSSYSYILVGAPLKTDRKWHGIDKKIGQALRCFIYNAKLKCDKVPLLKSSLPQHSSNNSRSRLWVGASVAATTVDDKGYFSVCAPRFVKKIESQEWTAAGECYLFGIVNPSSVMSPCSQTATSELGQCLTGFSASVHAYHEGKNPVVFYGAGMPTSYDSNGDLFIMSYESKNSKKLANEWSYHKRSDVNEIMAEQNRSYYFGYSMRIANLDASRPKQVSLIASRPMWGVAEWKGAVTIMDVFIKKKFHIKDNFGSLGDSFGYCLTSSDLDGDGYAEIIIGAPFHSNSSQRRYNSGRVYVFYGLVTSTGQYQVNPEPTILEAQGSSGRFGHSVSIIGDLDDDGLQDFGVGCPYCGKDGNGEVYIYLSRRGKRVSQEPYQILGDESNRAPDGRALKQFGWSLTGGVDFDKNGYPDVVVGSCHSASIVLYKSRPVVRVVVKGLQIPTPLAARDCNKQHSLLPACRFNISGEIFLSSRKHSEPLSLNMTLNLDSRIDGQSKKRVTSARDGKYVITELLTINANQSLRFTKELKVTPDLQDIITPIDVQLLIESQWDSKGVEAPAMHPDSTTNVTFPSAHILKPECGEDNTCKPDLRVALTDQESQEAGALIYGNLAVPRRLKIEVTNRGEMAHFTILRLNMPVGIIVQRLFEVSGDPMQTLECSEQNDNKTLTLECQLGHVQGQRVFEAKLIMEDALKPDMEYPLRVKATVACQSEESVDLKDDNEAQIEFEVFVKADLIVSSAPNKNVVLDKRKEIRSWGKSTSHKLSSLGAYFNHTYEIFNTGPSPLTNVQVNITFPLETEAGEILVYLLDKITSVSSTTGSQEIIDISPRVLGGKNDSIRGSCRSQPNQLNFIFLRDPSEQTRQRRHVAASLMEPDEDDLMRPSVLTDVLSGSISSAPQEILECRSTEGFGTIRCGSITCMIDSLPASSKARVVLDGLLWAKTLFKYRAARVQLRTKAQVGIANVPFKLRLHSNSTLGPLVATVRQHFLFTGIKLRPVYRMPMWAIILSVSLGLVLLILIIVALWKCGFFYRRRWASEKQPAHL